MIVYNITVKVEKSIEDAWIKWMKDTHIPDVMKTKCFVEFKFRKLLSVDNSDGNTFAIQYSMNTINDYMRYQDKYAPKLQSLHNEKFKDKYVAFRTLMEDV